LDPITLDEQITLAESLERSAKKVPYKPALIWKRQKITFTSLLEKVRRVGRGLSDLGVRPKDRVALLLPNCPEYIYSYYAINRIGGVAVPVNSFLKGAEVSYILSDCQVHTVITTAPLARSVLPHRAEFKNLKHIVLVGEVEADLQEISRSFSALMEAAPLPALTEGDRSSSPSDLAVIIYTSGTTGRPKGAMLTNQNLIYNVNSCRAALDIFRRDRFVLFLPLFHSFTATVCMLLPIHVGCMTVLLESVNRKDIRHAITRYRVTIFVAVPALYNVMAQAKISFLARWLNPVRIYVSGGAPLSLEVLSKFEKVFQRPLLEGYGLSEASPVVSVNPLEQPRKPGSVGLPLPGVEVKVVNWEERELPRGEVGELIVRGGNVMMGYYNQPEATAQAIRGGWLFTGDLAKVNEDGYVTIVDRKKDMLIVRGCNVYPREVEEVLYAHPKVAEAAVIGMTDRHRGEVPKAYIVLKEGMKADEREIKRYLMERLARYKIPRLVEFRDSLPMTPTGKVLKRELRDALKIGAGGNGHE
jgi:long-chain acyl-CoA synthetase